MRTLALDPGERRIGVAISDPTGAIAQPLETISTRGLDSPAALKRLAEIVETHDVSRIVIGLPLHMDGREGPEAAAVREFGGSVAERTALPVHFLDERWSTREAERALRGVRGRKRERVDRVAATLLLQTFLERGE